MTLPNTLKAIPVFYRPQQNASREAASISPSAAKPGPVVDSWKKLGVPLDIRSFKPLSRAELSAAHAPEYIDGVMDLDLENGFGNFDAGIAMSLPLTSGSFVAAALCAWRHGGVAVSPTSGFHHAGYRFGGGFCTFNGLAIAAAQLLKAGVKKLAILDCDAHHGNGTEDILKRVAGFKKRVLHYTRGAVHYRGPANEAQAFLDYLPKLLAQWKEEEVEVVLYQAGADPHLDDPIGCQFLSTEQLHARDTAVFQACADLGLPIAWNLAGGYQEDDSLPWPQSIRKVLDIHDNTMRASAAAFLEVPVQTRNPTRHTSRVT